LAKAELPAIPKIPVNATTTGLALRGLQTLGTGIYEGLRGMHRSAMTQQLGNLFTAPQSSYRDALIRALMAGKGAAQNAGQAASQAIANPAMISALISGGRRQR
jgi:hypothetical protein